MSRHQPQKDPSGSVLFCAFCAFLWLLSNDADEWFVAGDAVEGEGELVVAFEGDRVGEFDGDLGEGEGWEFADVFDEERIEVVVGVFELDGDGFAGEQINAGGEEHDARALIGAEVEDVSE